MGDLETVSSKSGFSSCLLDEAVVVVAVPALAYGFVGETTSSCHVFLGAVAPCLGVIGPVGVIMVEEGGIEDWATFWNTWMGRASKNSWARMKGVHVSSARGQFLHGGNKTETERQTLWHKSYVLAPLDAAARDVLARCCPANLALLQLLGASKALCLLLLQVGRCFDEIDGLDALCEALEARDGLVP